MATPTQLTRYEELASIAPRTLVDGFLASGFADALHVRSPPNLITARNIGELQAAKT
jgi:hypothetical protein